jgi:hypothetical protein
MRLSILALFIALPAAAYAAVCPQGPQQGSNDVHAECAERGQWCNSEITCCGRLQCVWNGFASVYLTFTLIHMGAELSEMQECN